MTTEEHILGDLPGMDTEDDEEEQCPEDEDQEEQEVEMKVIGGVVNVLPQKEQGGHSRGGGGQENVFQSSDPEEVLKQRINTRMHAETQEKAKSSHNMRQSLLDAAAMRDKIPIMMALIDYLTELKETLEQNPEQFYCSRNLPPAEGQNEQEETTSRRRKRPVMKREPL